MSTEIRISLEDIKDVLNTYMDREPTGREIELFIDYLQNDVGQWLVDNAKSYVRDHLQTEERRY